MWTSRPPEARPLDIEGIKGPAPAVLNAADLSKEDAGPAPAVLNAADISKEDAGVEVEVKTQDVEGRGAAEEDAEERGADDALKRAQPRSTAESGKPAGTRTSDVRQQAARNRSKEAWTKKAART